jgi:ADP-ribose pyrophosphatase
MDVVSFDVVQKFAVFSIKRLVVKAPHDEKTLTYHVVDRPDSVQIVAVTDQGRHILVEQERQGTRQSSLEFVAGLLDEGESPRDAAARELEEETGYCAADLHELGWYYSDPAILTSKVTVFLADKCVRKGEMNQDEGENVHTRLYDPEEVDAMIADGTINHGLCLSAWYLYQTRVQRSRSRT